jgi:plasmid stability protein
MTTLTIRDADTELKGRLQVRAARNGRSSEAESCHIPCEAFGGARKDPEPLLAEAIRGRFRRRAAPTSSSRPACADRVLPRSIGDRPRHECALS